MSLLDPYLKHSFVLHLVNGALFQTLSADQIPAELPLMVTLLIFARLNDQVNFALVPTTYPGAGLSTRPLFQQTCR